MGRGEILQPHESDGVVDPSLDLGWVDAGAAQTECDVVSNIEPGKGSVFLEDDTHAFRHAQDWLSLEMSRSRLGRIQAGQNVEQGGLAATGGTDDGKEFPSCQGKIDRTERVQAAALRMIDAGDPAKRRMCLLDGRRLHRNGFRRGLGRHQGHCSTCKSAGRKDLSINFDQSTSPLISPVNLRASTIRLSSI